MSGHGPRRFRHLLSAPNNTLPRLSGIYRTILDGLDRIGLVIMSRFRSGKIPGVFRPVFSEDRTKRGVRWEYSDVVWEIHYQPKILDSENAAVMRGIILWMEPLIGLPSDERDC